MKEKAEFHLGAASMTVIFCTPLWDAVLMYGLRVNPHMYTGSRTARIGTPHPQPTGLHVKLVQVEGLISIGHAVTTTQLTIGGPS